MFHNFLLILAQSVVSHILDEILSWRQIEGRETVPWWSWPFPASALPSPLSNCEPRITPMIETWGNRQCTAACWDWETVAASVRKHWRWLWGHKPFASRGKSPLCLSLIKLKCGNLKGEHLFFHSPSYTMADLYKLDIGKLEQEIYL